MATKLNDTDVIIAVTQRSINDQLKILYNTKFRSPNGKPNYLFHHDIAWKTEVGGVEKDVNLQVESPIIDLSNVTSSDPLVKVSFRVTKGTVKKSVPETVPPGTLSWFAHLDSAAVQTMDDSHHPDAVQRIKPFVNNKDYLVSSLFLRFEQAKTTDSFHFSPDNKALVVSQLSDDLLSALIFNFCNVSDGNPYILGYVISQSPNRPADKKVVLDPRAFRLALKPHPSDANLNTLNYYLFLDPPKSANDGKTALAQSLVISAGGDLIPFNDDGVLAISSKTFQEKVVKDILVDGVVDKLWLSTNTLSEASKKALDHWAPLSYDKDEDIFSEHRFVRKAKYRTVQYKEPPMGNFVDVLKNVFNYSSRGWEVYQTLEIDYSSALADARVKKSHIGPNDARFLILNFTACIELRLCIGVKSLIFNPDGEWADGGYDSSTFRYSGTLKLSTADNGKWTLSKTRLDLPPKKDGKWVLPREEHFNANVITSKFTEALYNPFGSIYEAFVGHQRLLDIFNALESNTFTDTWVNSVNKDIDDLSQRVITPAGNVFTSKGLDSDARGHVYTHLKYDTPTTRS